ncbi:hypothetical protein QBC36DRAFT_358843 [Triangularia setosa]|uniref:Uncharacterized protein n=1 Tax=Triangularia setosa TaxID=2587417 RepID=A0AAN6W2E9_9PEZI|nr:hypothetical protein QBC36DRAFT_358843 [Podospora setosa]
MADGHDAYCLSTRRYDPQYYEHVGVSLDPRNFAFGDRLDAALALMREVLAGGGRAEGLGVILSMPPRKVFSTTPNILELGAGIKEYLQDRHAMESGLLCWLKGALTGFLNEEGYVNLKAPVASVMLASSRKSDNNLNDACPPVENSEAVHSIRDHDDQEWDIVDTGYELPSPPYAVYLGDKQNYLSGIYPTWTDPKSNLFMLVD